MCCHKSLLGNGDTVLNKAFTVKGFTYLWGKQAMNESNTCQSEPRSMKKPEVGQED